MEIKSLKDTSLEDITASFLDAFSDYAVSFNQEAIRTMLKRRGYNAELSFGAFDKDNLVAFTLNGIDSYNGKQTAYDIATGTIKSHRGKGLTKAIFQHSLPYLKAAKLEQYLLEVLKENEKALSIYQSIGFKHNRKLSYYDCNISELKLGDIPQNYKFYIEDSLDEKLMSSYWDFQPAWQNSLNSIERDLASYLIVGIYNKERQMIGYAVLDPNTGDIPQIGIDREHRRKGAGKALINHLMKYNKSNKIRLLNIDSQSEAIKLFLDAINLNPLGQQYEMSMQIL